MVEVVVGSDGAPRSEEEAAAMTAASTARPPIACRARWQAAP